MKTPPSPGPWRVGDGITTIGALQLIPVYDQDWNLVAYLPAHSGHSETNAVVVSCAHQMFDALKTFSRHPGVPRDRVFEIVEEGDEGFCLSCGAEADGVEPDARGYRCDVCGNKAVYGAEELLLEMVL